MRLRSFLLALSMLTISLAARADPLIENYTATGSTGVVGNSLAVYSSAFARFDPSLGTLDSITVALSGTANSTLGDDSFSSVEAASNPNVILLPGTGGTSFRGDFIFPISANGTLVDPTVLSLFEGTGTQAFQLNFSTPTQVSATGTLTYNYSPALAATPEPSSFALLGTGLLGLLSVVRRRRA